MNIQENSSKCNKLSNVIFESTESIPHKANLSDTSHQVSNRKRHKLGNTKEACKYKDCANCLNVCSIISPKQGIHLEKKEHTQSTDFDKVFVSKHKLMVKLNNSGVKSYKYSESDKCFTHQSHLSVHQGIHTGEKPYKCSESDNCFTDKVSLTSHQIMHTGEKPYKCSECGKCFTKKSYLSIHQRIHTGEKPYKCSECDQSYTQESYLIFHQRIHTGEKPYKCSECEKCFTKKSYLSIHQITHMADLSRLVVNEG
jgi:KRAB domain-containing zinc finger protein